MNTKKLCLSFATFIIIPILFIQTFFILKDFSNSINNTYLTLEAVSNVEKDNLGSWIDYMLSSVNAIAGEYNTLAFLKASYKNNPLQKLDLSKTNMDILVTNTYFSILSSNFLKEATTTHLTLEDLGIDLNLIKNSKSDTFVSNLIQYKDQPPFIFIASRVKNTDSNRSTLGYVISKYPIIHFNSLTTTPLFSNTAFSQLFVTDANDTILLHSTNKDALGENLNDIILNKKMTSKKDGHSKNYISYQSQSKDLLMGSFTTLDAYGWNIFCVTNVNSVFSNFFNLFITSVIFTILLFILLMISGVLFLRKNIYPISALYDTMSSIYNGNLTARWNFQNHKILGGFSKCFNNMMESIKTTLDEKTALNTTLLESEVKYNNILATTQNLIIEMDIACNKIHISNKWTTLIGTPLPSAFSTDDLINLFDYSKFEHSNLLLDFINGCEDFYSSPLYLKLENGTLVPVIVNINVVRAASQKIKYLTCIISDILNYNAASLNFTHDIDSLTNLFSKRNFLERAEKQFDDKSFQCFIGIDIDNMKNINDDYGYDAGDEILKQAAHRLQKYKFANAIIGRDDSLDFVLFFSSCKNIEDCIIIARVIQNIFKPTFKISNIEKQIPITCSIGVCTNNSSASHTIKALLEHSKIALLESKKNGKNQIKVFSDTMLRGKARKKKIKDIIKNSFGTNNLFVHFQPIYNADNIICEFEAFIKLTDSALGEIKEHEFIAVAQEEGLILDLSRWYFYECCLLAHKFINKKIQFSHISLNLSLNCIKDSDFLKFAAHTLNELSLNPAVLQIDISESSFLADVGSSLNIINNLSEIGVCIGLCELSSIYQTLDIISNSHFNRIKISAIFIQNINHSTHSIPILTSIFAICNELNLPVIVQGIETDAQYNLLKSLNCQFMQGPYLHKPMPERELYHAISVNHGTNTV